MPKRKTRKRIHTAAATLSVNSLSKAGSSLGLRIYAEGERIGELAIGRGGIFWRGGKRWRTNSKRISWSRFADIMNKEVYGA